jgi:hypothetical protein
VGIASLSLFALKTGYEFVVGHALLAPDLGPGVRLLPAAHVFGALAGFWCVKAAACTSSATRDMSHA